MHAFNFFPSFDLGFDAMRGFHFFSLCFDCSETWLCLWFKFYSPHSVCVCHFRWELVCLELHLWWEQRCWSLLLFWTGTELSKLTLWPSYNYINMPFYNHRLLKHTHTGQDLTIPTPPMHGLKYPEYGLDCMVKDVTWKMGE